MILGNGRCLVRYFFLFFICFLISPVKITITGFLAWMYKELTFAYVDHKDSPFNEVEVDDIAKHHLFHIFYITIQNEKLNSFHCFSVMGLNYKKE